MIANIKNILKIEDLRNKILFTLMIVGLYRVGAAIRVPGVDPLAIEQLRAGAQDGALGLFNLFSGGAFESFSVFALGIMPYITASIIMQILGVVIPKLEELQQQGAVGQRKITQYTRYVTVTLALLQATVLVFLFGNGGGGAFYSAVQAPSVPLLPDGIWPRGYLIISELDKTTITEPRRDRVWKGAQVFQLNPVISPLYLDLWNMGLEPKPIACDRAGRYPITKFGKLDKFLIVGRNFGLLSAMTSNPDFPIQRCEVSNEVTKLRVWATGVKPNSDKTSSRLDESHIITTQE